MHKKIFYTQKGEKNMEQKNEIRLQKFLADNGIASRRKCEEIILQGRVKVNEKVIVTLGTKIKPYEDFVEVDGKILKRQDDKIYVLLNKPIGYVTTVKDQFKRDTVMDLLKDIKTRIVPVGRLDMYTSGALILSNDGDFVNNLYSPNFKFFTFIFPIADLCNARTGLFMVLHILLTCLFFPSCIIIWNLETFLLSSIFKILVLAGLVI